MTTVLLKILNTVLEIGIIISDRLKVCRDLNVKITYEHHEGLLGSQYSAEKMETDQNDVVLNY